MAWLWHGYLATGNVTLLTGPWKCGKTTLLAALLSRLGTGGALVGLPVAAARAVVTEESPRHWHRRAQQFGFGPHLCWLCRPFRGKAGGLAATGRGDERVIAQTRHRSRAQVPGRGTETRGSKGRIPAPISRPRAASISAGMTLLIGHPPATLHGPRMGRGRSAEPAGLAPAG